MTHHGVGHAGPGTGVQLRSARAYGTVKHGDATNTDDVSVVWSASDTVLS